jgi:Ca-activated chloride channel homolog
MVKNLKKEIPVKRFKWLYSPIMFFIMFAMIFVSPSLHAASNPTGQDNKTLSPYFFVKSDDPTIDRMPLKSTSAHVSIAGVIADVQVFQVYKNEGKKALEAIYIFPASTRAAVHGMRMTIGKRIIEAKIDKREDARRQYDRARQQGKNASLLEQQRPNVFQMNVANIMPGDEIKVELRYTELLVPTDKIYEFVYPTVVGPRYSNKTDKGTGSTDQWVRNPYLHQGEDAPFTFDIDTTISGGMAIKEITSASHKVRISYDGPAMAKVALDGQKSNGGNRDYVLRYRLDDDKIQSGLLLYEGEKENFFLLMMEPPKRVIQSQIPGREYVFVVDVSGSMHGYPLDISKKLMADLLGRLRPTDKFNILLFSGGSAVLSKQPLAATDENIRKGTQFIDRQQGGGGTELLPALERVFSLPKTEGYARNIIIATDGYVQVEEEAFDLIRKNLDKSNVFTFGIGTSVNRHLIEGMARVGLGEPFVITKQEEAGAKAREFRQLIESPVLTNVSVKFDGFQAYDVEPISVPDILSERPVIIFGKYRGHAQGSIAVHGITGEGPFSTTINLSKSQPSKENSALRYLWARVRIALLSDYNLLRTDVDRTNEVTRLGLAYNLLTAYTSFVAIDSEIRNADGTSHTVKQPLPLPDGVSDYAIGEGSSLMRSFAVTAPSPSMGARKIEQMMVRPMAESGRGGRKDKSNDPSLLLKTNIEVSTNMSKTAVQRIVDTNASALQSQCLNGVNVKFTTKIIINGDGTIKSAEFTKGAKAVGGADECILQAIQKWSFTPTTDNKEGTIIITFTTLY